jgi:hypothetical protein
MLQYMPAMTIGMATNAERILCVRWLYFEDIICVAWYLVGFDQWVLLEVLRRMYCLNLVSF